MSYTPSIRVKTYNFLVGPEVKEGVSVYGRALVGKYVYAGGRAFLLIDGRGTVSVGVYGRNEDDLLKSITPTLVGDYAAHYDVWHDRNDRSYKSVIFPGGTNEDENYVEWDLGTVKTVAIYFKACSPNDVVYGRLKVSTDGQNYTTILTVVGGSVQDIFTIADARYIRLTYWCPDTSISRAAFHVYEVEAFDVTQKDASLPIKLDITEKLKKGLDYVIVPSSVMTYAIVEVL